MPAATCRFKTQLDCRPCFYPLHCTAFIRRHPFLHTCTYPPRAPGTPLAVRYYSTELAPDMEEEEEEDKSSGLSEDQGTVLEKSITQLIRVSLELGLGLVLGLRLV